MTWKKINTGHKGRTDVFGGNDIDKISDALGGTTVTDTLDINSSTTVRNGKLKFPNPANSFNYIISPSAITANRNITLPTLLTNGSFLMQDSAQIMTSGILNNCSFDATAIPTSRFAGDPILSRWGTIFPRNLTATETGVASFEGILSAHTLRSPFAAPAAKYYFPGDWVGYHGQWIQLENTATVDEYCGVISPTTGLGICRMSHDGRIRVRWAQNGNDAAFWCGLSSSSSAPLNKDNPLGNSQSGIVIGNTAFATDTEVVYHNGDGTSPHRTTLADSTEIATGQDIFKDMDIKWSTDEDGLYATAAIAHTATRDATYTGILTQADLPAANTDLYFHCHLVNATNTNSEFFSLAGIWIESR